jgi:excisionase family DNA binding protein
MTAQNKSMSPLLTVVELAHYLRVHPTTIYRMLRRHRIPAFRVAHDWRLSAEEIDRSGFRDGPMDPGRLVRRVGYDGTGAR